MNKPVKIADANGKPIRPIMPVIDRAQTLDGIDKALDLIESLLNGLESKSEEGKTASAAFQSFMTALAPTLSKQRERIKVKNNASWIKIESVINGHKVYVSKGKLAVGRIDSTLDPDLIPGAKHAGVHNGRISSWLPPNVESVGKAVELLGSITVTPLKKR